MAGRRLPVWLGIQQWRAAGALDLHALAGGMPRRRLFRRAVLVNLTNPKSIVFLAALFPQFILPNQPQAERIWCSASLRGGGYSGDDRLRHHGDAHRRLAETPRQMQLLNRVFGSLFILVAGLLATAASLTKKAIAARPFLSPPISG